MDFITGKKYENRRGVYLVVSIQKNGMLIRYEDGAEQLIRNIELQKRIVRNILNERNPMPKTCLCSWPDENILPKIRFERLPDFALMSACCWRRICQVRGRNPRIIDEETWINICTKRGYMLERQNPRGF